MKRFKILILLIFCSLIYANPVWEGMRLSEIYFDMNDHWFIEIDNNNYWCQLEYVDSIEVRTSSGSAIASYVDTVDYIILTNGRMANPLNVKRSGDYVSLYSYGGSEMFCDSIIFGDTAGSYLKNILPGTSIARYLDNREFYKDDSPTLFSENNLNDASAILYGHFTYSNGLPITNRSFYISNSNAGEIRINEDGYYCVEILCRTYDFDRFGLWDDAGNIKTMSFIPQSIDLEPHDSIEINFTSLLTSITPVIQNTIMFNNYPHPASNYTWFVIDNTEIEASAMRVIVYALNGRKVDSFKPGAYQYRYDCSHLPQGSYIMSLQHGKDVLATKKLQIMK